MKGGRGVASSLHQGLSACCSLSADFKDRSAYSVLSSGMPLKGDQLAKRYSR